ncbi:MULTISPECIES: putative quinol monooxygenase [unclassified Polaromonas]|uniref:putative quinol monooxygenase n=1 Tax=unclassified Polaromonas TaxID=2638319 RepID=UPI000F085325|nr:MULTISPECIES: putative quinol monooxygenase [unclassified Polaromonas]AYQ26834.1 antibiotic biosynthesis monooxygenase [Polaromonas sp. SP1]QGJ18321.1 antibiotic biosynthesis monooxygenase [Polaromonas sp. Pch-P]
MSHTLTPSRHQTIRKLVRITAKPNQAAVLGGALRELEFATRQEPGCLEFVFFQALSAPHSFVLLEAFRDQAALDSHMALPHTRRFFEADLTADVSAQDIG